MPSLRTDVTNAVWHAFDSLDEGKCGTASKSRVKVFTSSLGTVLGLIKVEDGLEEFQSGSELRFQEYMTYLEKELFSKLPTDLEPKTLKRYYDQIEEMCWHVCKKKFITREFVTFPAHCVMQLFRVFCLLGELRTTDKSSPEVVMVSEEVEEVTSTFVRALGREWDAGDFHQIASLLPTFRFQCFLAFLETRYTVGTEPCGLLEATSEIYDTYVEDILKKGFLKKKMSSLGLWFEMYCVLRPHHLVYYNSKDRTRKSGEIRISPRTRSEPVADTVTGRGHRFTVVTDDKTVELSAPDYKSKLQWIAAIQLATQHSSSNRMYQHYLASKRKSERLNAEARRKQQEEERVQQLQLLEKEKAARRDAEENLKAEHRRRQELEAAQQELESKLAEERQAKRDEEIVRTLQSRMLAEEWEKREMLEKEKEEQLRNLEEERQRREELERIRRQKDRELSSIARTLSSLKSEKLVLTSKLQDTEKMLTVAETASKTLERKLKSKKSAPAMKRAVSADLTNVDDLLNWEGGAVQREVSAKES
uniref:Putative pleckstrin similarity domain protein n=1 Tax=Ornithodoros turicata TaxID=34597 RepID=A0A2R5LLS7_9ACAR